MMAGASSASSCTAVQYSESVAAREAGGGGLAGDQHPRPGPPHHQGRGPLPPPQRSKVWPGKSTALFLMLRVIAAMLHPGNLGVEQTFKYYLCIVDRLSSFEPVLLCDQVESIRYSDLVVPVDYGAVQA